jgi:hypothetical protein
MNAGKPAECSYNLCVLVIQDANEDTINLWWRLIASCLVGSSLLLINQKISPICEFLPNLRFRRLPDIPATKLSALKRDWVGN